MGSKGSHATLLRCDQTNFPEIPPLFLASPLLTTSTLRVAVDCFSTYKCIHMQAVLCMELIVHQGDKKA